MKKLLDSPIIFDPILKQILWGGRRLGSLLGKQIGPDNDYAESWEIADHTNGQSVVIYPAQQTGCTIHELVTMYPKELLGIALSDRFHQFPLLIKFLDAHQVLSIQVHPDDALAQKLVNDNGKNEAWIVLHTEPGSRIYAGLKTGVNRQSFQNALQANCVSELVHSFEPKPGDCIMIPAGTVHAIGAGIVLAEIQQMSDATFRVDDWGRIGTDGKPRQLHLTEALEATDFDRGPLEPAIPQWIPSASSQNRHEKLIQCPFFEIGKWYLNTQSKLGFADHSRFTILIITDGKAIVSNQNGASIEAATGCTLLLPAAAGQVDVKPLGNHTLQLLECYVP